ncbi:unnamed protein product [Cylicostephanus goldi]|uniref:Bardet-Biedl syndrome 1 N-terminal domain-containing protein n=1 Tax=Cylicostephanus goldi TaxID=71465 RepID=A0A3P7MQ20_CYLGO|nr:unnamed protein product [Cylicostephanus goldi]
MYGDGDTKLVIAHVGSSKSHDQFDQLPAMTSETAAKWMSALSDDQAGVYTFSNCVCLSDMYGDGDTKLVIAHVGSSK